LLIGADGRRSTVARACAAPYADVRPGRSCAWYAYWDHSPLTEARAELRHGIFAGAFPTHNAQVLAFVQLPVTAWRPRQGEQDLRAGLARCPSVAAGLDNAELSGRVVGVRDLPTYFRQAAGTGWGLVGDAAHHKDPLAARGISDALLGAELLADHVLRGWDNDLDQALHLYAAELTRMLQPTAYLNDELARLDLPAETGPPHLASATGHRTPDLPSHISGGAIIMTTTSPGTSGNLKRARLARRLTRFRE
jgi:2-polyprenyl-6-methoxyphenol hydroxylase-like FAD-dependent oxidoreductase